MGNVRVRRLTEEELEAVLLEVTSVIRLMILVCYYHGLRATEVCYLTGRDIRDGYLTVQRLKGSRKTRQPFIVRKDSLLDESAKLVSVAAGVGDNDYLFPDFAIFGKGGKKIGRFRFHYVFKVAATKAGMPPNKRTPHVLKHSTGMRLIKQGFAYTKDYLGHESASSTGAYLNPPEEETFNAAKTAFGE